MPGVKRAALSWILAPLLLLALSLAACTASGPKFVEHGAAYTKETATQLLASTDISQYAQRPTTEADALRHTALTRLRRRGPAASTAAELLTKTFPSSAHGVPVYVELGSYEGTPSTILVEATGPATGKLDTTRLWAIAKDGQILFAASR